MRINSVPNGKIHERLLADVIKACKEIDAVVFLLTNVQRRMFKTRNILIITTKHNLLDAV